MHGRLPFDAPSTAGTRTPACGEGQRARCVRELPHGAFNRHDPRRQCPGETHGARPRRRLTAPLRDATPTPPTAYEEERRRGICRSVPPGQPTRELRGLSRMAPAGSSHRVRPGTEGTPNNHVQDIHQSYQPLAASPPEPRGRIDRWVSLSEYPGEPPPDNPATTLHSPSRNGRDECQTRQGVHFWGYR